MKFLKELLFGKKIKPVVYTQEKHQFSLKNVDKNAVSVLEKLDGCGYDAYLVGGVIRDGLMGLRSKDCDVVTNAKPETIVKRLKSSIIIGRRFRLVHVRFGPKVIEVSTFRSSANSRSRKISKSGIIKRDNVYGRIDEDVMRRDFTVNALYYRYRDNSILDFVGGLEDLKNRRLRSIGDPLERFPEDPVRMLRAIRFSGKLLLNIDDNIKEAIQKHRNLLTEISGQRLFSELVKLYYSGHAEIVNNLMVDLGIWEVLSPAVNKLKRIDDAKMLWQVMSKNADARFLEGKRLSVTYLFACLYWPLMADKMAKSRFRRFSLKIAMQVLQSGYIDIPLRIKEDVCEIWKNQYLFRLKDKAPRGVSQSKRLRASYELLCQRAMIDSHLSDVALYWESHV